MGTEGIQLLNIHFTLACSWGSCPRWPWLITASIPKYICFLLNFVRTLMQWWSPSRSGNFKCVFCILARFFCACIRNNARHPRPFSWLTRGNIKQLFHGLTMPPGALGKEIHSHPPWIDKYSNLLNFDANENPSATEEYYFWVFAQKWRWHSELHHKR